MNSGGPTYVCSASHPSLGDNPAQGRLLFSTRVARFESELVNVELPSDGLRVDLANDGASVVFSHPNLPDWVLWTEDAGVLRDRVFRRESGLRNQVKEQQQSREGIKRLKLTFVFLCVFAVAMLVATQAGGWMVNRLINRIPASFEKSLGDDLLADVMEETETVEAPELTRRLKELADRLGRASGRQKADFKVTLLDEEIINAFALPGGRILVNKGLFRAATTPVEVAGVLAHEIAHLNNKDGFRSLLSALGPYVLLELFVGGDRGLASAIAARSGLLVHLEYSREVEFNADDAAWDILVKANIDPRGLAGFLVRSEAEEAKLKALFKALAASEGRTAQSHPETEERVLRLEARWKKLGRKEGFAKLDKLVLPWEDAR